jgi:hypothetical protein
MTAWEDVGKEISGDAALVIPNEKDYWSLVAGQEPRYAKNAKQAEASQQSWTEAKAFDREPLVGPPFPATDRPMFWLYVPLPPSR